jgi:serine/threonine protein kinase
MTITEPTSSLPMIGEEIFGYRLRRELGSGTFARVFLAEQVGVPGRPVVLKVSSCPGTERETLAQLQHTHIMPSRSYYEDSGAGLRAVCMPFFGGSSLSHVLGAIWTETSHPIKGAQLVRALQQLETPYLREPIVSSPQPLLKRFEYWSYIEVAAWIVACLADGLQHAHQRGILHRDVKPSNILIGADGQPRLLDFNLAHDTKKPRGTAAAELGGTVAYMAPEHLRAMASCDPALARLVDRRSDIYSLGMVLYEMLVGHKPFDQNASHTPMPAMIAAMAVERAQVIPSVRERRTDVPWGLESIVRTCLHPDRGQRYQQAAQLAEDLRAFLEHRPLQHAPELSYAEVVGKWACRHPRLTVLAKSAAVMALMLGGLAASVG